MPLRRRTSASTDACVIVAGWHSSDLTLPRLSASVQSFTREANALASSPPSSSKEITPPKSFICRAAIAWPGCDASPGKYTRPTRGWPSRNAASARAFEQWRSIRTAAS